MLIGVVTGSIENARNKIRSHPQMDVFEVRLDTFEAPAQHVLYELKKEGRPLLATQRTISHGGGAPHQEMLSADYVDREFDSDLPGGPNVICSFHAQEEGICDLHALITQMKTMPAFHYKVVVKPRTAAECLQALSFCDTNVTVICMGAKWKAARVLIPVYGGLLQYINLDNDHSIGQLVAEDLNIYNYNLLNTDTKVYCLCGDPITQSPSHRTHNRALSGGVYVKFPVRKEEFASFLDEALNSPIQGGSITMPLKHHFGSESINTFRKRNGQWEVCSTDGVGAFNALSEVTELEGKSVHLIGAGGAAASIAKRLAGFTVYVSNRTISKARKLGKLYQGEAVDIIINTLPPDVGEIPDAWLEGPQVAMDVCIVPKETTFLRRAKAKGCIPVYGEKMFIYQAVEQFRFWEEGNCLENWEIGCTDMLRI